jgi:ferredoxin
MQLVPKLEVIDRTARMHNGRCGLVTATAYEKRNIAAEVPRWDADLCIQCGQCSIVCPHSVIRAKYYPEEALAEAPAGFPQ